MGGMFDDLGKVLGFYAFLIFCAGALIGWIFL